MAPNAPPEPDAPISVRLFSGEDALGSKDYIKVKIRYADITAGLPELEQLLRAVVGVEEGQECHFKRYSDSSSGYICLTRNNRAAYRQLIRAAKAKQRLKLCLIYGPAPDGEIIANGSNAGNIPVCAHQVDSAPAREPAPASTAAFAFESAFAPVSASAYELAPEPASETTPRAYDSAHAPASLSELEIASKTATGPRPVTIEDISEVEPLVNPCTPAPISPSKHAVPPLSSKPRSDTAVANSMPSSVPVTVSTSNLALGPTVNAAAAPDKNSLTESTQESSDIPDIPGHYPEVKLARHCGNESASGLGGDHLPRGVTFGTAPVASITTAAIPQASSASVSRDFSLPYSLYGSISRQVATHPRDNSFVASDRSDPEPMLASAPLSLSFPVTAESTSEAPTPNMCAMKNALGSARMLSINCSPSRAMPPAIESLESVPKPAKRMPAFTVFCNSCRNEMPDVHYHCSICEDGDYDLCQTCLLAGVCCNDNHWLIRRTIENGLVVCGRTERFDPSKIKADRAREVSSRAAHLAQEVLIGDRKPAMSASALSAALEKLRLPDKYPKGPFKPTERTSVDLAPLRSNVEDLCAVRKQTRTCNNCIHEFTDAEFLHCSECFDFDLCQTCFIKNEHGHHPKHTFKPAVEGTTFGWNVTSRLSPGRGCQHQAICDGCDRAILGVRYKCMICPDWDYCSNCMLKAHDCHPNHNFTALYEPLVEFSQGQDHDSKLPVIHSGIFCDGPHCVGTMRPIHGDRYKCAICDNIDFCSTCESSPVNKHHKTHPLIKFRTSICRVHVSTFGEHGDGALMPIMGDRHSAIAFPDSTHSSQSKSRGNRSEEVGNADSDYLTANTAQTIYSVVPTSSTSARSRNCESNITEIATATESIAGLSAEFQSNAIVDGTVLPPNYDFDQTWVIKNTGDVAWPAGCHLRYMSGNFMLRIDKDPTVTIHELASTAASTVCTEEVAPGAEFSFTVKLRSPRRTGVAVSFWRLTDKSGTGFFGHRLWCAIKVETVKESIVVKAKEAFKKSAECSQMILSEPADESSAENMHAVSNEAKAAAFIGSDETHLRSAPAPLEASDHEDDVWVEDGSDGFLTDDEYDILDASDQECLTDNKAHC